MSASPCSTGNTDKVIVGLNMGASELYNKTTGKYEFKLGGGSDSCERVTGDELANFYKDLVKEFSIEFIEDAFGDWRLWTGIAGYSLLLTVQCKVHSSMGA